MPTDFTTEIGTGSNADSKTDFSNIASEFKDSNQKILLTSMDYQTETTMISAVQKMQKAMVDNLKQGVG
jgi:prophage DNA circulation protein